MIIDDQSLNLLPTKFTMIGGAFDPIHEGHIEYFKKVSEFGYPVVLSLDPDSYVMAKHQLLLKQYARAKVLDSIKYIDYVYLNCGSTAEALALLKPKYFVKGVDWEGRLPTDETLLCEKYQITIKYLDTKLNSSSKYLVEYNKSLLENSLKKFEELYFNQVMPSSNLYDVNYYQGDWRKEDSYTLESRRVIEGKNPKLIKHVFNPNAVLDVGCGPGFLMMMLYELNIDVYGVDHSNDSISLAPDDIKSRITIIDFSKYQDKRQYDLIICREVVEHLPLKDVYKIVNKMCAMTSKYVYLTTRFNNESKSIFDVTTEFDVDPTHITIMDIHLLRLLFVLNGMKRRTDLEIKMDWLDKRRVLIYEKI